MTRKEKIGLWVIVGILSVLGIILAMTVDRPEGPTRGFDDNALVEQRMKNLERSR